MSSPSFKATWTELTRSVDRKVEMAGSVVWQTSQTQVGPQDGGIVQKQILLTTILAFAREVRVRNWCKVALYTEDSLCFLSGFLGALLAGAEPCVLPHVQNGFIEILTGEFDVIVHDGVLLDPAIPAYQLQLIDTECALKESFDGDFDDCKWRPHNSFSFWTSGSTGTPKRVVKPLTALEAEVAALEERFGGLVGACFAGTVSHQHYYGAIFRVFWPFLTGRKIWRSLLRYPHDLAQAVECGVSTIASSPAFLTQSLSMLDIDALKKKGVRFFSSGAMLPSHIPAQCNDEMDWVIAEILGSTETGGVASRITLSETKDTLWQPLPNVCVTSEKGSLLILSSATGSADEVALGDLGEVRASGDFSLKGRKDQIIKIGEKRINLSDMIEVLNAHALISECAVIPLRRNLRIELAAVAVLNDAGFERLLDVGHHIMRQELQAFLERYFERVTRPKKWRFVRSLPQNAMGKTSQDKLTALFMSDWRPMVPRQAHFNQPRSLPDILDDVQSTGARRLNLYIPPQLKWFEGHFPDQPVLPGVVQLEWAAYFGSSLLAKDLVFQRMQHIKFTQLIQADCKIELNLLFDNRKGWLNFSYKNLDYMFSSGRFVYV